MKLLPVRPRRDGTQRYACILNGAGAPDRALAPASLARRIYSALQCVQYAFRFNHSPSDGATPAGRHPGGGPAGEAAPPAGLAPITGLG